MSEVTIAGSESKVFAGTAPSVAIMGTTTWVPMPTKSAESVYGFPRTSKRLSITCVTGTLAVGLDPTGMPEFVLTTGQSWSDNVALQGFHVRSVGGSATYQATALLRG